MKKFRLVLSICLIVLILLSMTSCDLFTKATKGSNSKTEEKKMFVPTTAIELWEKIDRTMDALESYQCEGKVEIVSFYDGQEIKVNSTTVTSEINSKDGYAYLEESESTIESSEKADVEKKNNLEAFYNGKMYISNKDSSSEQKFMSEVTAEKYFELKENSAPLHEVIQLSCDDDALMGENPYWGMLVITKDEYGTYAELYANPW